MGGMYFKLIAAGAVALIVFLGYRYVVNLQETNAALTGQLTALQVEVETYKTEVRVLEQEIENSKQRISEVNVELNSAREAANKTVRLFSDHNLQKLIEAKPEWMSDKMQRATAEKFRAIEGLTQ